LAAAVLPALAPTRPPAEWLARIWEPATSADAWPCGADYVGALCGALALGYRPSDAWLAAWQRAGLRPPTAGGGAEDEDEQGQPKASEAATSLLSHLSPGQARRLLQALEEDAAASSGPAEAASASAAAAAPAAVAKRLSEPEWWSEFWAGTAQAAMFGEGGSQTESSSLAVDGAAVRAAGACASAAPPEARASPPPSAVLSRLGRAISASALRYAALDAPGRRRALYSVAAGARMGASLEPRAAAALARALAAEEEEEGKQATNVPARVYVAVLLAVGSALARRRRAEEEEEEEDGEEAADAAAASLDPSAAAALASAALRRLQQQQEQASFPSDAVRLLVAVEQLAAATVSLDAPTSEEQQQQQRGESPRLPPPLQRWADGALEALLPAMATTSGSGGLRLSTGSEIAGLARALVALGARPPREWLTRLCAAAEGPLRRGELSASAAAASSSSSSPDGPSAAALGWSLWRLGAPAPPRAWRKAWRAAVLLEARRLLAAAGRSGGGLEQQQQQQQQRRARRRLLRRLTSVVSTALWVAAEWDQDDGVEELEETEEDAGLALPVLAAAPPPASSPPSLRVAPLATAAAAPLIAPPPTRDPAAAAAAANFFQRHRHRAALRRGSAGRHSSPSEDVAAWAAVLAARLPPLAAAAAGAGALVTALRSMQRLGCRGDPRWLDGVVDALVAEVSGRGGRLTRMPPRLAADALASLAWHEHALGASDARALLGGLARGGGESLLPRQYGAVLRALAALDVDPMALLEEGQEEEQEGDEQGETPRAATQTLRQQRPFLLAFYDASAASMRRGRAAGWTAADVAALLAALADLGPLGRGPAAAAAPPPAAWCAAAARAARPALPRAAPRQAVEMLWAAARSGLGPLGGVVDDDEEEEDGERDSGRARGRRTGLERLKEKRRAARAAAAATRGLDRSPSPPPVGRRAQRVARRAAAAAGGEASVATVAAAAAAQATDDDEGDDPRRPHLPLALLRDAARHATRGLHRLGPRSVARLGWAAAALGAAPKPATGWAATYAARAVALSPRMAASERGEAAWALAALRRRGCLSVAQEAGLRALETRRAAVLWAGGARRRRAVGVGGGE
jgi:hypothetical protein